MIYGYNRYGFFGIYERFICSGFFNIFRNKVAVGLLMTFRLVILILFKHYFSKFRYKHTLHEVTSQY